MVLLQMVEMLPQTSSTNSLSIPPADKNPVDYLQQDIITNLYFDPTTENELIKIIGSL